MQYNEIDPYIGFEIRRHMQEAKHKLLSSGYEGLVSFVKAAIISGDVFDHIIGNQALAIGGPRIRDRVRFLIEEAENEHWVRTSGGRLDVL